MYLVVTFLLVLFTCVNASADVDKKINKELNIIYTNDIEGSVDTCGCATDPGGGAVRRINWYKKNNLFPTDTLYINGGNTLFAATNYMDYEIKYLKAGAQILADSMTKMNIDAFTPGEQDFKMGLDFFLSTTKKLPIVLTNSGYDRFLKELIIDKAGYKIGIIGILSDKVLTKETVAALSIKDPIAILKDTIPNLKKKVDIIVLILRSNEEELPSILKNANGVDIILSAGINEELTSPSIKDNSVMIRTLIGGDSIGLLKYKNIRDGKKVDIGNNNSLMAKAGELDLIMNTIENKESINTIKSEKEKINELIVKADENSSKLENRIDFLGKVYSGKNSLSQAIKKYEVLRKNSTPR
ncbi:MAG: hypothetical protein WCQ47_03285 [bacterium]